MSMHEAMKAEREEAIATLEKANDLLMKMFNLSTEGEGGGDCNA